MSTGRFSAAIAAENAQGLVAVIPDIKCVSPKEGDLLRGRGPAEAARCLVSLGAPVLSVVTERLNFGGSPELLRSIAKTVSVPILRKDFISSCTMLEETAELGAAAVLLICATLDDERLTLLYEKSLELGLEPFVEIHTARELAWANKLGARLIGVNNREILSLERDDGGPSLTAALVSGIPSGSLLVSESGILTPGDAQLAASAGADAILVGTALWLARDMDEMYQSLRAAKNKR